MMKQNPLRVFRKEKGWTRADLARRTGVNYQTIDHIETGLLGKVTKRVMAKLLPFGIPKDLPEQYQVWRAIMRQYVEPKEKCTEEGEVHVEDLEEPAGSPTVESLEKQEDPTEASLDESTLGEGV
jgi:transcriptional regulator with XRE-family HTH domain